MAVTSGRFLPRELRRVASLLTLTLRRHMGDALSCGRFIMQKTLILIRHGHRDNSRRELDNGLTEKGQSQAKNIRRFFAERFSGDEIGKGLWLVSSPKVRCMETLQPTAK